MIKNQKSGVFSYYSVGGRVWFSLGYKAWDRNPILFYFVFRLPPPQRKQHLHNNLSSSRRHIRLPSSVHTFGWLPELRSVPMIGSSHQSLAHTALSTGAWFQPWYLASSSRLLLLLLRSFLGSFSRLHLPVWIAESVYLIPKEGHVAVIFTGMMWDQRIDLEKWHLGHTFSLPAEEQGRPFCLFIFLLFIYLPLGYLSSSQRFSFLFFLLFLMSLYKFFV